MNVCVHFFKRLTHQKTTLDIPRCYPSQKEKSPSLTTEMEASGLHCQSTRHQTFNKKSSTISDGSELANARQCKQGVLYHCVLYCSSGHHYLSCESKDMILNIKKKKKNIQHVVAQQKSYQHTQYLDAVLTVIYAMALSDPTAPQGAGLDSKPCQKIEDLSNLFQHFDRKNKHTTF